MSSPSATDIGDARTPLQDDLVAMLRATRAAERDLFASLDARGHDAPLGDGSWSAKDVQAHLAAWRAIEARRLVATATGDAAVTAGDPRADDPIDEANATMHAQREGWSWAEAERAADDSLDALVDAILASSTEALCECDTLAAGIGANGINHALGHLSDVAQLTGDQQRFGQFADQVEAILQGGHLPPRDSGVMLYNIACHNALSGRPDEARRLLRIAVARRPDLLDWAAQDPDIAAVHDELDALAGA